MADAPFRSVGSSGADGTAAGDEPRPTHGTVASDDRAVSPAVGKALEAALVVLFVAAVGTALYGGVVPDYRTAVGDEVAERTVAAAAERVAAAVPPPARAVRASRSVDLPATIRGSTYRIRAVDGTTLRLAHPTPGVGATARLAMPEHVVAVSGTWTSPTPSRIHVVGNRTGVTVTLVDGEGTDAG